MSNTQGSYAASDTTPDTVADEQTLNATNPDALIDSAPDVPENRDDSEPGNNLSPQLETTDAIEDELRPHLNESSYTVASSESDEALLSGFDPSQSGYTDQAESSSATSADLGNITARQLMHADVSTIAASASLVDAARLLRDLNVGSLPVMDSNGTLIGIITDRDIVISAVASRLDLAATSCGEILEGNLITVSADDDLETAISAMQSAHVRRLPVMDKGELVGIISQADIARRLPFDRVGELVGEISST